MTRADYIKPGSRWRQRSTGKLWQCVDAVGNAAWIQSVTVRQDALMPDQKRLPMKKLLANYDPEA